MRSAIHSTHRFAIVVVAVAGLVTCRATPPGSRIAPPATDRDAGQALYARYCALCHGASGEGYRADHANALSNQDFLRSANDSFLRAAIAQGRPGTTMSAWGRQFGGPLSSAEVDALVERLRAWQREPSVDLSRVAVRGDPNRAVPVFATRCAPCHGAHGQGKDAVSLNNPVFLATASDGYLRVTIAEGRRNTPMKGFEATLSAAEIDDLVALIRSWARPPPRAAASPMDDETQRAGPVLNPEGLVPEFALREGKYVPARQLLDALGHRRRLVLVDARGPAEYARGHIPGAVNIPFFEATRAVSELPKDGTWIVAYCGCPHAEAGVVMNTLRNSGYPRTAVLDEGIFYWQDQGYPMLGSVH